jgi:uncharacterized protein YdeI (YjbR/CyaY-like superfamily)
MLTSDKCLVCLSANRDKVLIALKHYLRISIGRGKGERMLEDGSRLKRSKNQMPEFVKQALEESGLMGDYKNRPTYQQNDYIGWINRAKQLETKEKRLHQMLDELKVGGVYMKMSHPASKKS